MPLAPHHPTRYAWSEIQEDHAGRDVRFLDYPRGTAWYAFREPDGGRHPNEHLQWLLGRADAADRWEDYESGLGWRGYLMPLDELERLAPDVLRRAATALGHRFHHFSWVSYLRDVGRDQLDQRDISLPLVALWHYVRHYNAFLHRARSQGAPPAVLFREPPASAPFPDRLPGEQCVELLLLLCRRPFGPHWDAGTFRQLRRGAHPPVRAFFDQHQATLERVLAAGDLRERPALAAAFYACCGADLAYVSLQESLDRASAGRKSRRKGAAPPATAPATGFREVLRELAARIGLLERIRSARRDPAPAAAPRFAPPYLPLAGPGAPRWYELPPATREERLAAAAADRIPPAVAERWHEQLRRMLEQLTAPELRWTWKEDGVRPAWNLPPEELAATALLQYRRQQRLQEQELARLDGMLPGLHATTSLAGLTQYLAGKPPFRTPGANRRWREAAARQREKLAARQRYRRQRMEEFGVDDAKLSDYRKELWLDELLRVEEEVRPYLAYVRRAFQAALPVGTSLEFDPYRHRYDGIEFDPDTVQDPDKWLRGDVLKTLRSRRDYAPITQVNTFCLDYSRSMTHDLMRQLFKTVFLLVTGLENRKTYDAIHFFGSGFHEVAGFEKTGMYTNRKLLFRVLRNVSQQDKNTVIYGGQGGTNISAGVAESHRRLRDFARALREDKPDANVVESLFVLTDGQPTMGITDLAELNAFIAAKRRDGDVAIKGIYLKAPDDDSDFINQIFGAEHAVSAASFEDTVTTFVEVMGRTYREQRREFRAAQKRRRLQSRNPYASPASPNATDP